MKTAWARRKGFTIVELLIVIVVIGILAAITIVAYNGIQTRARDTQRASDLSSIVKALEIYRTTNGLYPAATSTAGAGSWEESNETAGTFMEYLNVSKTPTDPTNNGTYRYRYHRYNAGYGGCTASRGAYYVLIALFESASSKPTGSGLNCPSYVLTDSGTQYIMAKYENE